MRSKHLSHKNRKLSIGGQNDIGKQPFPLMNPSVKKDLQEGISGMCRQAEKEGKGLSDILSEYDERVLSQMQNISHYGSKNNSR